jgi:uncharacterized membrane protein YhaH (DUF805 family)
MSLPRLRRRSFWLLTIAVWAVFFAARELFALEHQALLATGWAAMALLALGTLCAARLHDRSRSAWWLAAALVPVIGALWLACELALRRGSAHANRFGPDPRQP